MIKRAQLALDHVESPLYAISPEPAAKVQKRSVALNIVPKSPAQPPQGAKGPRIAETRSIMSSDQEIKRIEKVFCFQTGVTGSGASGP